MIYNRKYNPTSRRITPPQLLISKDNTSAIMQRENNAILAATKLHADNLRMGIKK